MTPTTVATLEPASNITARLSDPFKLDGSKSMEVRQNWQSRCQEIGQGLDSFRLELN